MIFKTFENDIDKISAKWGVFGRSFNDIGSAIVGKIYNIKKGFQATDDLLGSIKSTDSIWKRLYPSKENIQSQLIDVDTLIPKIDENQAKKILKYIKSIEEGTNDEAKSFQELYDTGIKQKQWIAKYAQETQGQIRSIEGVTEANKSARDAAISHNKALYQQTLGYKAATAAAKALSIAGNMIAMWAISQVISGFYELSKVSENVAEKAKELGDTFKNTSSDIDNYKSQIQELYETINDSGSSIEDVTNARKTLMSVQDELIDKFGTEKNAINDISDAINGQTEAFDRLTQRQWQEVKNNYNNSSWWNGISNKWHGYSNNIERMLDEYGDYSVSTNLYFSSKSGVVRDYIVKELKQAGYDIDKFGNLRLSGTATDIYNQLVDIQDLFSDENLPDDIIFKGFISDFQNTLTKLVNSAQEVSNKYKDFYDQYILYEKILTDNSGYADTFNDITDAYKEYYNAFASGNEDQIKESTGKYADILSNAMSTAFENGDEDVASYFENMYPALKSEVDKWKFNVAFDADEHGFQRRIRLILDKLKDENGRQLTIDEILRLDDDNDQYLTLLSIADKYNMTLEEMLELLKERNLVVDMDYQGLVNLFGQDNVDKITPEDLEIAYKIKNVGNMTFDELVTEIQRIKDEANAPISLSKWQSSNYSPDQTYSDLIKDWESQTKQLQSVLSDIRSGDEAITAADIVSQFPDLQPYIDQCEDLALAVDTFMRDSYEELLDKFGDTSNIEGFSYELEYLQGVLNEGLGGANNIDHLVSTYEELIGILDQVNSDHTFTEEEIANLINKYDALKDAVIITTDGYKLEDDALIDLINNYISLSNTAISNQIELTQTTIDGIEARVKAWGMEIEALKTVAKIYNATGGSKDAVGQYIYDNYGTNLTSATPAIIAAATEYAAASDQLDGLLEQLNNSYAAGSKYKSNGNSSSESKSFTDTLEKELAALDKSMEAGYINFNDYITARLGLIEEYYRKGRIAADEYYSYLEKHYDQQLSAMDRVVNAVTRRIDTEIDGLEKQKDSIESVYNAQIESLEKQKTLLQEANKERERQVDLQKALYELERAKQQKTKMVFTEDGGMRYVTDDDAIKAAGQNVDDARLEIQIAELDRSISKLEEARDRETAAFDERISKLKEYKDSWSDLTSAYEEEQDNLLAAQILGQEWEEDILNGRLDTLDAFKNQYISIQQAMADAAWQSANEQIKAAQEAQKGASGTTYGGTPIADTVTSPGPHTSLGSKSNIKYVAFHEYASGTDNAKKGINLVGEDGTEAYFDNHGHIALITEPTLIPMEGGEVVKNESATRKLLNPNNLAAVDTGTLAGVDSQDPIASGRLRPIQSGDRTWELQQSLIAYLAKMGSDINALLAPVNAIQRDTEQLAGTSINTNHIHNANQMQQVTIGDIHVTCPGVTSQEIMNQVGEALNRQLGGIALDALQESTKR